MSDDVYQTVLNLVQRLSTDEQFQLLEDLAAALRKESQPKQSILEPEGLGKEIGEGVDPDEYIRKERRSTGESSFSRKRGQ
jgi:hypothetical protein